MNGKLIVSFMIVFMLGWLASSSFTTFFADQNTGAVIVQAQENSFDSIEAQEVESEVADTINSGKSDNDSLYDAALEEFETLQNFFIRNQSNEKRNKDSPQDWIAMDQIRVYNNRVIIDIKDPEWALFTDTKSMDPVIDSTSNAIEVVPKSPDQIQVGDIVAYESKYATGVITHRVVEIGSDSSGWYARLQGDNNPRVDPGKVRFDQIKRVVVAIIY